MKPSKANVYNDFISVKNLQLKFEIWEKSLCNNRIKTQESWQIKIFVVHPAFVTNGILLPKLFWPTVRKNCSNDWEKLLKFEAEGREFAKFLRSLEQFIQTVKGQNNFW